MTQTSGNPFGDKLAIEPNIAKPGYGKKVCDRCGGTGEDKLASYHFVCQACGGHGFRWTYPKNLRP